MSGANGAAAERGLFSKSVLSDTAMVRQKNSMSYLADIPTAQNPYAKYANVQDNDKDSIDDGINMDIVSEASENGIKDEESVPQSKPNEIEILREFYDYMQVMTPMSEPEARAMAATTTDEKWTLICNQKARSPIFQTSYYIENLKKHTGVTSRRRFSLTKKPKEGINSVGFILRKLKADLKMSPSRFIYDFVQEPNNGIYLLVSLLNEIQTDQAATQTTKKSRIEEFNRTLSDEYDCMLCLLFAIRNEEGLKRLLWIDKVVDSIIQVTESPKSKSRTVALQILKLMLQFPGGHLKVAQAIDKQRIKFGETFRFKLLMNRLNKPNEQDIFFMVSCVHFLNQFLSGLDNGNSQLYMQHEMEVAGFDTQLLTKHAVGNEYIHGDLQGALENWKENHLDVTLLKDDLTSANNRTVMLRNEVNRLQMNNKELEKKLNHSTRENVKLKEKLNGYHERAAELKDEVESLKKKLESHEKRMNDFPKVDFDDVLTPLATDPVDKYATVNSMSTVSSATSDYEQLDNNSPSVPPVPAPPPSFLSRTVRRKVFSNVDLPLLNWTPITSVRGTIFENIDDDELLRSLDFSDFEKEFKLPRPTVQEPTSGDRRKRILSRSGTVDKVIFMNTNRAKNIIITQRKIGLSPRGIRDAIDICDKQSLSGEYAELLLKYIPTKDDLKLLAQHSTEYQNMGEAEQLLFHLSKVERLESKLSILVFMSVFDEIVKKIQPQIQQVLVSSNSVLHCTDLASIFELILAFGNYMNSSRRGYALGFRLDSLQKLSEVKSSDKKRVLLQFIVQLIQERNPELLTFHLQLKTDVDKGVSYQAILADVLEMRKGLDLIRYEREKQQNNNTLENFIVRASGTISHVVENFKKMEDSFKRVCLMFGENYRDTEPDELFKLVTDFVIEFKEAHARNIEGGTETRQKMSPIFRKVGNRKKIDISTNIESNILQKYIPRSRPLIPFEPGSPDLAKDEVSKFNQNSKVYFNTLQHPTTSQAHIPSSKGVKDLSNIGKPLTSKVKGNHINTEITKETGYEDNKKKFHLDLNQSPINSSVHDNGSEIETSVISNNIYSEVIKALKKTRSPMYADVNEQMSQSPARNIANQKQTVPTINSQTTTNIKNGAENQNIFKKAIRPNRVSIGNTPNDVKNVLAVLNTVINEEEQKDLQGSTTAISEDSYL